MTLRVVFIEMFVRGAAGRVAATHGRIVLLGTFVLLTLGSSPAVRYADGQQTVQQLGYPKTATSKSGLRLTIERPLYPTSDNLIDGIRIKLETADRRPSRKRREIAVRLELRVGWNDNAAITVPVALAEGESEVVFDVPFRIPLATWGRSDRLAVAEDGSLIGELSDEFLPIRGIGGAPMENRGFSLLVIDRDVKVTLVQPTGAAGRAPAVTTTIAPTGDGGDGELLCVDGLIWAIDAPGAVRQGHTAVRSEQPWNLKSARAWYGPGRQLATLRAAAVHPQYAMTDWRWYTEWSMVALSQDELAHLASSQPVLFEALRRWVSMGGVLLITGNDVDALERESARRFQLTSPEWRRPDSSFVSPDYAENWQIPELFNPQGYGRDSFTNSRTSLEGIEPPRDAVGRGSEAVRWAAYRWGAVVIADRQSLARSALPWIWMMQTLPLNGASLDNQSNASMWKESAHHGREWIANTQAASFPFFLLLVLSFLFVIGPVNLMWARQRRAPVRVILTSPVIASVTLAVFVMTVVATEGIRTRRRVRAVTWLDSERGEAYSWSHQSHYALMAPARLTYPAGTQLTPFLPSRQTGYHYELRVGRDWTTIDGSFLQSRSLVHLSVGDFQRTAHKLSARELQGRRVRVRNRLGTGIELLVLRGRHGDWYLARDINQGDEVRIQATNRATVRKATRAVLDFDEAYDPAAARKSPFGRSSTPGAPERLEWETHRLLEHVDLQPGQFLAVVEDSPFVSSGVSSDVPTRNLELVTGSW